MELKPGPLDGSNGCQCDEFIALGLMDIKGRHPVTSIKDFTHIRASNLLLTLEQCFASVDPIPRVSEV